ncbi:ABC transporter ATP-binding protein [Selenomonas ruminantium]|uniref:Heme exporter protein A n=1 Tax=Selenomonas ruminantium TaxID=971 RepID=A0A1H0SG05_SELRU|nr:ATP-binding cassette domain-containing protein [Selenomonas ruminantium]SDP40654.1 heme exporter protein A [Selenomonas ruminantium]
MVTIEFAEVSQRFHGRQIFAPLDVTLFGGKITAVTGQNGSGKSTFLKLAGHLLLPSSGKVAVTDNGTELHKEALRQRLAMVTPELRFYDRLTARENMDFLLGMWGINIDDKKYRSLLAQVGLAESAVAHSYAGEFSTGMRQRLKIAVLLASGADIWLLDEPGANLDKAGRGLLAAEIRRAAARGVLVALATNDPGEEALADEVISLAGR